MPKIIVGTTELDADVRLAIARAANGNHAAFDGLRGVIVDQQKRLADDNNLSKSKHRAVSIYGLRLRAGAEFFSVIGFTVDGERNGQ